MSESFSAKAIAPSLQLDNAERAAACRRATSLIYNLRNGSKVFAAAGLMLEPLLVLLPHEPEAAGTLATFADYLTKASAYPEALRCIDAVIDRPSDKVLGTIDAPWEGTEMTWPWQQALLAMWRGECRFAAGDRDGGEASFADAARRAEAANMPEVFGLTGARSPYKGTVADRRLWALIQGANALRLHYEGKDPCAARKVKKRKPKDVPDPKLLATARRYLDDALAVIGSRVATQYAGLEPRTDYEHPSFTSELKRHAWQRVAYFESGLVYELLGELDKARQHLGRAKWISALGNPSHRHEDELLEVVTRLGIENVPLA